MDPVVFWIIIVGVGSIAGASAATYLGLQYPKSRAKINAKVIEAYNWLDKHKADIPEQLKPAYDDIYKGLDHYIDAWGDDEISPAEAKQMGLDALEVFGELVKLVKG